MVHDCRTFVDRAMDDPPLAVEVFVWDLETGSRLARLTGPTKELTQLVLAEGGLLVTTSKDRTCKVGRTVPNTLRFCFSTPFSHTYTNSHPRSHA